MPELATDSHVYKKANKDRHEAWRALSLILKADTLNEAKTIAKTILETK